MASDKSGAGRAPLLVVAIALALALGADAAGHVAYPGRHILSNPNCQCPDNTAAGVTAWLASCVVRECDSSGGISFTMKTTGGCSWSNVILTPATTSGAALSCVARSAGKLSAVIPCGAGATYDILVKDGSYNAGNPPTAGCGTLMTTYLANTVRACTVFNSMPSSLNADVWTGPQTCKLSNVDLCAGVTVSDPCPDSNDPCKDNVRTGCECELTVPDGVADRVCRAKAGCCDVEEKCTSQGTCPSDSKADSDTVCAWGRVLGSTCSGDECKSVAKCDGSTVDCPYALVKTSNQCTAGTQATCAVPA